MSALVAIRLVGLVSSTFAFGFCTAAALNTRDPLVLAITLFTGVLTVFNILRFGVRP